MKKQDKEFKIIDLETMDYDDIENSLVKKVREELDSELRDYKQDMLYSMQKCESPIEQLLAMQLSNKLMQHLDNEKIEILGIENQKNIIVDKENYRVDFLLELALKKENIYIGVLNIVIECDGYEFHHKSKEQVQKDYLKDRNLQKNDYLILRFSGSEIYDCSLKCVYEIIKIIKRKYEISVALYDEHHSRFKDGAK